MCSTDECFTASFNLDNGIIAEHRGRVFGHDGAFLTFSQGFLAKKTSDREFGFYRNYKSWIHDILPEDVVPHVEGVGFINHHNDTLYQMTIYPSLLSSQTHGTPYLLLGDIIAGYKLPAVLDIKLGTRTWEIGASPDKVERHRNKCAKGTTKECGFRIRAGMWRSADQQKWPASEGKYSVVDRSFGTGCSTEEMIDFLTDFFHNVDLIPKFILKLKHIRNGLERLRSEGGIRMYSSSILCVYDDEDSSRFDCRVLDFEKTYFNIENTASRFNESIEDCEDEVIPAVTQIIEILSRILPNFK